MKFQSLSLALNLLVSVITITMAAQKVYHNQFAVEVEGGKDAADALAEKHGLVNLGQIGALQGHFLLESARLEKR